MPPFCAPSVSKKEITPDGGKKKQVPGITCFHRWLNLAVNKCYSPRFHTLKKSGDQPAPPSGEARFELRPSQCSLILLSSILNTCLTYLPTLNIEWLDSPDGYSLLVSWCACVTLRVQYFLRPLASITYSAHCPFSSGCLRNLLCIYSFIELVFTLSPPQSSCIPSRQSWF